jgi:hypothetical protein
MAMYIHAAQLRACPPVLGYSARHGFEAEEPSH